MSWQCWIDVGGTFTDCIGQRPDGRLVRHKLLSSGVTKGAARAGSDRTRIVDDGRRNDPAGFWTGYRIRLLDFGGSVAAESPVAEFEPSSGSLRLAAALPIDPEEGQPYELISDEEAPVIGVRYLLGLRRDEPIPPIVVRLGTTRGTNALITRRGAKVALVTTQGFGDVLRIGYQNRPKLFDLAIREPEPLFTEVIEIHQRTTPDGQVLVAPDAIAIREQLATLKNRGIESLAVCFLHAYAFGEHEQLVGRIARETGFEEISLSSQVAPLVKIVARGDTTVIDAYLNPVLRAYVERLRRSLGASRLQILTSAGGLVDADRFVGKDSILSGPAGGVVGFSAFGL
jgi:5-oxoprolinase (ATP-hydrolysing)